MWLYLRFGKLDMPVKVGIEKFYLKKIPISNSYQYNFWNYWNIISLQVRICIPYSTEKIETKREGKLKLKFSDEMLVSMSDPFMIFPVSFEMCRTSTSLIKSWKRPIVQSALFLVTFIYQIDSTMTGIHMSSSKRRNFTTWLTNIW